MAHEMMKGRGMMMDKKSMSMMPESGTMGARSAKTQAKRPLRKKRAMRSKR